MFMAKYISLSSQTSQIMDQTDVITHAALVFTELYRKSFASINLGNLQDLQNINNTD